MALMPPPPPPPSSHCPIKTSLKVGDFDHDSDSDQESDTGSATPSALSPTTPRQFPDNSDTEASGRLLDQLKSAVEGYPSLANYCCGGSIPISTSSRNSPSFQDSSKAPVTSPPITLRFDTHCGSVSKIHLPSAPEDDKGKAQKQVEIEDLLAACTPDVVGDDKPGRGHRGKTRRSSAKLEKDKFSVDVHPADLGVLDTIKQVLLPDLKVQSGEGSRKGKGRSLWDGVGTESWREREEHWGVRAELCELSVHFSSTSNSQKPFETAPRRGTHFGTLVICLPSAHQGGGQLIHHPTPQFNPSLSPPQTRPHTTLLPTASLNPMITWSAFPRTTSHSILPITCGHLITLTYNLYVTEAVGGILQRYPIADPRLYPLFKMIKGLLSDSHFMPDGGTLGQHCIHTYSHTRRQTQYHMPYSLLGTDAILFSVFRALGLKTMVGPVLGDEAWDEWMQIREEELFRKIYEDEEMEERARAKREESDDEMDDEEDDGEGGSEDEFEDGEETARVGKGWWRLKMVAEGGECEDGIFRTGKDPTSYINKHYPLHAISPVTWLNDSTPNGWEIAMVNLKSSSQATPKPTPTTKAKEVEGAEKETRELMWQYSHAAIFVEILPFGKGVRGGT